MGRLSKVKWCLFGCLIVVLVLLAGSVFTPDGLTQAVKWTHKLSGLSAQKPHSGDNLVEMVVDTVGVSQVDSRPVVLLKEKDGELYLPIWIGLLEANAISVIFEGVEVPRPLTPDLLCSVINRMGATVERIIINDLRNQTFYANIILNADGTTMEVDARPSDAIAVALRTKAPIYAERTVLDKAGIRPSDKTEKYT